MTTKNYNKQQEGLADRPTVKINFFIEELSQQLNKLDDMISRLEQMGHRIKNTDYPKGTDKILGDEKNPGVNTEEGYFTTLSMHLHRLSSINNRVDELGIKLSEFF